MSGWLGPAPAGWERIVDAAYEEDLGHGDLTACLWDHEPPTVSWRIEAQAPGVLCGSAIAAYGLLAAGPMLDWEVGDGSAIEPGTTILRGRGPADRLLARERVALNFLMHLSGVATLTRRFVEAVEGTGARIVDTRKTLPGLRALQKYAVRCGGGSNHRMGLYDGLMIKDNHIAAAGGVAAAVRRARERGPHTVRVEVECATPAQVDEAVEAGAEIVMLDNMGRDAMRDCVSRHRTSGVLFEASGGVDLESVRQVAETGVDLISVGALTHSAPALPIHLEVG